MKICILHRHPKDRIKETNASFPYLLREGVEVKTFKKFNRTHGKFWKSLWWIFYSPWLVLGKGYDVIYLDDSFPFYGIGVRLFSPRSKIIKRMGDLHLMYYTSGRLYRFLHWFERIEWNMMSEILAISNIMAIHIAAQCPCVPVETILDPVDPKDFQIAEQPRVSQRVMFHGTITKNKGLDVMLDAARILKDVQFWIVGNGEDMKRLEKIAPNNVYFTGWIPFKEVKNLISMCDVGLALRASGGGNEFVVSSPFLQYSVMGKPCIVSHRLVFDDMNYAFQYHDASELCYWIDFLLRHPEEGIPVQRYVLEHHHAEKIAEEIWSRLSS